MTDVNQSQIGETINIGGVVVFGTDPKFSQNMYKAMVHAAQGKIGEGFGNGIKIQEGVWNKELLVECNIEKLSGLIAGIQDKFNFAPNKYNSLAVDTTRQVGEYIGSFEYEGKGYIILFPRNAFTDETILQRGVYKGVIVNPELYFSDEAQEQVAEGAYATKRILDGEV